MKNNKTINTQAGSIKGLKEVVVNDRTKIYVNQDVPDDVARARYMEKLDRSYKMLIRSKK